MAFSFNKSVYNFYENMSNATIYVEKTSGSIVRVITLLVTGCKFSRELLIVQWNALFLTLNMKEKQLVHIS